MAKSIIQDTKQCYVCNTTIGLHDHHVFFGSNRKISEQHGLKVWLCGKHHNLSNEGVHFNKKLDLKLKKQLQLYWMKKNNKTIEDFITLIGRNYI